MSFKDNVRTKTGEFLSNSLEMFEKIFAQATQQLKIKQKPKPAAQEPVSSPATEKPRSKGEKLKPAKQPERIVQSPKPPEKVRTSPPAKARPTPKPRRGKGSGVLRGGLLIVLLLVLAGFLANHFAIIDLTTIPDLLGLGAKPVVQAPIPRKQAAKPSQKPVVSPTQPQAQEKVPTAFPAPSVQTPTAVSKEEKLVELETPTTIAQSQPAEEPAEEKAPPVAAQVQPKPPQVAAKQETQPAPVQTQATAKPAAPEVAPSKPVTPQYPYSVYLGSFKAPEAVKKALSDYQEKGLSAYWSRVDLGDKGVWFRFFAGYFRTKEEAEKYIRERNLQGATPGLTKYTNLIGSYSSDKDAEDQRRALVSAGFYPYVIKEANGRSLLYSAAFDRKEYAEKERALLASKGFRSDVVER